jgi:hypothetical protein
MGGAASMSSGNRAWLSCDADPLHQAVRGGDNEVTLVRHGEVVAHVPRISSVVVVESARLGRGRRATRAAPKWAATATTTHSWASGSSSLRAVLRTFLAGSGGIPPPPERGHHDGRLGDVRLLFGQSGIQAFGILEADDQYTGIGGVGSSILQLPAQ